MKTPAKNLDQYIVRFPDGMRDRLKAEAASNNRSLNAEIVARLERSFEISDITDTPQWRAVIETFVEKTMDARLTALGIDAEQLAKKAD